MDDVKARQTNVYSWLKDGIKILAKEWKQTEGEVANMIRIYSQGLLQEWKDKPHDDIPEILYDMYQCSLTYT